MNDFLLPHLLDLVTDPRARGLILAGGLGISLKQDHLRAQGAEQLIPQIPDARSTQDIDFFIRLQLFAPDRDSGVALRALMDELGYKALPGHEFLHFDKPIDANPDSPRVRVDFLAKPPEQPDEVAAMLSIKPPRLGARPGIKLHGRLTPEAFFVEAHTQTLPLSGRCTDGQSVDAQIQVPHAFSWLHLKLAAAHDWLQAQQHPERPRKPFAEKHVFDVYLLTAMLTEPELEECAQFAQDTREHPQAAQSRVFAEALYGLERSPGRVEVQRQLGRPVETAFLTGLKQGLGA